MIRRLRREWRLRGTHTEVLVVRRVEWIIPEYRQWVSVWVTVR